MAPSRPGQRIVARVVAGELKMSEIPVREALRRLSLEGLVSLTPHVGASVSELSIQGVEEALLIRAELQGLATRMSAGHLSDDVLRDLEAQMQMMSAVIEAGAFDQYGALNRKFHHTIYAMLPYPRLKALIEGLWDKEPRARSVFVLNPDRIHTSHLEHAQILNSLRAGDGERADEMVRQQKLHARQLLMAQTAERDKHSDPR
jgi:DNA-binding GntR family transcriptional regulator